MPVVRRSEALRYSTDHAGATFLGLAAPSLGSRENSAWEVTVPSGEKGAEHSLDHEEIIVVLSGRALPTIGETEYEVGPGDALIVPAHTDFTLSNPFDEPFTAIAVLPVGAKARLGDLEAFTPPWSV